MIVASNREKRSMANDGWTHQDLVRKLREFEQELREAGLKETTVRTYVDPQGDILEMARRPLHAARAQLLTSLVRVRLGRVLASADP